MIFCYTINQKNQNMGVFDPHIQKKEQKKNKENGKSAENKGKKMDNVLDYQWKLV
tara:strand:+ start:469 stop:633 length:165 start_codon:yes stop_codon:yes gene_type:complete